MAASIRLDKFLSEMNMGSRSQIREAAKKGRILVNDLPEKKADRRIIPGEDKVFFDGSEVVYEQYEYYMLNKPQGVVCATSDNLHKTVMDIIESKRNDLFPVGRLDIDTEGLLLITNDGELAHKLLSPKTHVDKVYYAKIENELPEGSEKKFASGIELADGTKTLPAKLKILAPCEIEVTLHEGKFHQVKRMVLAAGSRVIFLKRISMGKLILDDKLAVGAYRALTAREINELKIIDDQTGTKL